MRVRLVSIIAALAATFALANPASALGSLFTVRDVEVEATGDSGSKACDAAYGQGHTKAWQMLVQRLVPQANWATVPQPSDADLTAFVTGYEVSGEKRSTSKCIASMTYLFKGDLVKKYLREAGASYADRRGPATIVIPIYDTPQGPKLWSDDNLWLAAFKAVKLDNELIPVDAPFGDDGDKAAVQNGDSLGTDWTNYKTIADKYGDKGVLVAHASFANGQVNVTAKLVTEQGSEDLTTTGHGDDERGALRDAVHQLAMVMGESWKTKVAIDNSVSADLSVWAPYGSLAQRNSIEARLRKVQNVLAITVTRVTVDGMSMALKYRGRTDQFQEALKQANFGIYQGTSSGGGLVLTDYKPNEPMSFGGTPDQTQTQQPTDVPQPAPDTEEPQVIRPQ